MIMTKSIIFGLSGPELTYEEKEFFLNNEVVGFILFARNVESKEQIKQLTSDLKELYPHKEVPILIDQEGGRVARIKYPILSQDFPSAEALAKNYQDNTEKTKREIEKNYFHLMSELKDLGIDSPCAPVCDLRFEGADDVIGDRSFGDKVEPVVELARSAIQGILKAGGIPFMKHIPGHGRAMVDSHFELPVVNEDLTTLEQTDFAVFKQLASCFKEEEIWGMTAHIVYDSLDPKNPATASKQAIKYIREGIGFKNKLVSDDVCMYALHGDVGKDMAVLKRVIKLVETGAAVEKKYADYLLSQFHINITNSDLIGECAKQMEKIKPSFLTSLDKATKMALNAGCDVVLHCSGDLEEMKAVIDALI